MVDMIIRLTVGVVVVLGVMNTAQTIAVFVHLARHVARRRPHWGLDLWLPAFTSVRDVRRWLEAWREVLRPGDPALVTVRASARTVITRHVYLTLVSHTWALAIGSVVPVLA
jgi:hypothetical protein